MWHISNTALARSLTHSLTQVDGNNACKKEEKKQRQRTHAAPRRESNPDCVALPTPVMAEPTLDGITSFLTEYLHTADLATCTVKVIKAVLTTEMGAEVGRHYEKAWLKTEIDRLVRERLAEAVPEAIPDAAAPPQEEEPPAAAAAPMAAVPPPMKRARPVPPRKQIAAKAARKSASSRPLEEEEDPMVVDAAAGVDAIAAMAEAPAPAAAAARSTAGSGKAAYPRTAAEAAEAAEAALAEIEEREKKRKQHIRTFGCTREDVRRTAFLEPRLIPNTALTHSLTRSLSHTHSLRPVAARLATGQSACIICEHGLKDERKCLVERPPKQRQQHRRTQPPFCSRSQPKICPIPLPRSSRQITLLRLMHSCASSGLFGSGKGLTACYGQKTSAQPY